jgi:mono/diheme cytochrome c family protein
MRWRGLILAAFVGAMPAAASAQDEASVERGRYVVIIGSCNDCHTAGFAEAEGNVPEEEWLKGDSVGWRGPWGTTYPPNLRISLSEMTEDEWVQYARTFKTRPPMPWFSVNAMEEADLRSLYMYITSFEELGEPAPAYVPPDQEPPQPFIQFPEAPH